MEHSCAAPARCPREDLPSAVLREVFGHHSFRPGQREVIDAVLSRRDCLAIMPTGAGKSVTFQLPARAAGVRVLVVSPLLSLMRDQVAGACAHGLRATWVDSTLGPRERDARLQAFRDGSWELLYCSPEALGGVASRLGPSVGLLAVDEAHCVSEWGHDFRPAYRAIGEARIALGGVAVLAVTATATERVAADIVASLRLDGPFVWRGTFLRPNLLLAARAKDRLSPARATVLAAVRAHAGASGVVYCLSRRDAGALATYIRAHGGTAAPYHAGMPQVAREEVQAAFREGSLRTVVATVAFGMGIDKSDVRYVVHADLPASVESYAQEIGRAGRDGDDADCLLLYSWVDVRRRMAMHADLAPDRRADARRRLFEVYELASGSSCRHRALCAYFAEDVPRCASSCDSCGGRGAAEMAGERSRGRPEPLLEWEDPP